ncbi:hypothetical protein SAMN04488115_108254 [Bosea lathyri]|jgi:hypothetical protein|uniref:Uncharacterized protein n=1 Tax=Bosea lathyri TaxID=1036778 RepID=A0A1H6C0W0_9HYPH|nr:hypothetical protein SAMN04488115_108254 [Bosea lathyri]
MPAMQTVSLVLTLSRPYNICVRWGAVEAERCAGANPSNLIRVMPAKGTVFGS